MPSAQLTNENPKPARLRGGGPGRPKGSKDKGLETLAVLLGERTWFRRPSFRTRKGKVYRQYLADASAEYGELPRSLQPVLREMARLVAELAFGGDEDRVIARQHYVMCLRKLEPYRKGGTGGHDLAQSLAQAQASLTHPGSQGDDVD